jgi:hypothetical protein
MWESFKVLCVVVFGVCGTATGLMWIEDRPTPTTWILRIVFPILTLAAIGVFLALHFRRDRAPDYLYREMGDYFNRGGLCFAVQAKAIGGVAYMEVWFQNQHARECHATIGLRPARNFFLDRNAIELIVCDILLRTRRIWRSADSILLAQAVSRGSPILRSRSFRALSAG